MDVQLLQLAAFHLTGQRANQHGAMLGDPLDQNGELELLPALFTGYRDLTKLRHDFPLILNNDPHGGGPVCSLSDIIDKILRQIAPRGNDGERQRKHLLRLEAAIRARAPENMGESLTALWDEAAETLIADAADKDEGNTLAASFNAARTALRVDGPVIDCARETSTVLLHHLWKDIQRTKAERFGVRLSGLILGLTGILKADDLKSDAARKPENLRGTVGTAFEETIDFSVLSEMLEDASDSSLPAPRRKRIEATLAALEEQKFFPRQGRANGGDRSDQVYDSSFDSCTAAAASYQERQPEMAALVKAISIAELEIANRYRESEHDEFFERFNASALAPADLDLFPSYLVCLSGDLDAAETAALIDSLSSNLPIKILVRTDDLLGEPGAGAGRLGSGSSGARLASMAVGLNSAFVLQASASYLYPMRESAVRGLESGRPALFSIFSGTTGKAPHVPCYLFAASAMQSRAFPAFVYDPDAGSEWATRFSVEGNDQPEVDWPARDFAYEGDNLERLVETLAFSFIDFAACDRRLAQHFARVPREAWHDDMIPATSFLATRPEDVSDKVPYILMVDGDGAIHRVIVEDRLIEVARRWADRWRALREQGGINNSHATRLIEREREAWQAEKASELNELRKQLEAAAPTGTEPSPPVAALADSPAPAEPEAAEEDASAAAPSDDPYIETVRCTTCNECTGINDAMFVYDENKQAFIADPDAGTYRQLVDAAELCQVAIIHPGKPRNPDEPGLDELIDRAADFA